MLEASLFATLFAVFVRPGISAGEDVLFETMKRMKVDILEFRDEIEDVYGDRCSSLTLNSCERNNYDDCRSLYPNQTCPSGDFVVIPACGKGIRCNALFDWTVSTVRIPGNLADGPQGNPTDHKVVETICYSRRSEDWLRAKSEGESVFWRENGIQMYFGATDGTFRILPARQSPRCGEYDPRVRPWYIAAVPWYISASSGGRDIMLLIDSSRSVGDFGQLKVFQSAAKGIIEGLTVVDRVAVVVFNEAADAIGGDTLKHATDETKDLLYQIIDGLQTFGRTNYLAAFEKAFDVLDETPPPGDGEQQCNTAILFFTDTPMNYPKDKGADDVIALVESRKSSLPDASVQIFAYSSEGNREVRKIACGTGGIWAGLDNTSDVKTTMSNYHQFFAISLGDQDNKQFIAWEGPYVFSSSGAEGITASALVYDRQVSPPHFLGAVGMDLTMAAVNRILGYEGEQARETVEEIMLNLTESPIVECPVKLQGCELESLRYLSGGHQAICDEGCANASGTLPEQCSGMDEYPNDLWKNTANAGMRYAARACCEVGGTTPSKMCPNIDIYGETGLSDMAIFGIILGAVVSVEIIGCIYWHTGFKFLKRTRKVENPEEA